MKRADESVTMTLKIEVEEATESVRMRWSGYREYKGAITTIQFTTAHPMILIQESNQYIQRNPLNETAVRLSISPTPV